MKKLILLLALFVSGCQSSPGQIPFVTLLQATSKEDAIFRAHAPESSLVRDNLSWDEIWHDLTRFIPFSEIPDIDFDEYWVVVVVGEPRIQIRGMECSMEIRAIDTMGYFLIVTSLSTAPTLLDGGANLNRLPTYIPFHIVRIPRLNDLRSALAVEWVLSWTNFTVRRIN